jgi:predicted transcriptional regulator
MTSSTIELPSAVHERICAAAQQVGTTPHDMILQAVEDMLGRNDAIVQGEDRREQELMRTGLSIPHAEVLEYFARRVKGST